MLFFDNSYSPTRSSKKRNRKANKRRANFRPIRVENLEDRRLLSVTPYDSGDVPQAIPDQTTIVSTIDVGDAVTIDDVNVTLNISHASDQDLDVFLIAPDGTQVELFTDVGGGGDHFNETTLDDEATTAITSGSAPFSGSYRPEGSLSDFDGQDAQGVWTLEVTDDKRRKEGTLNSWSIEITSAGPALPTLAIDDVQLVEGDSGTTAFEFTVTRSGDTTGTSSVDFATADVTANAVTDYVATNGTVQFLADETSKTITVQVNGDTDIEPDEVFTVVLSKPTDATIADGIGDGTITDDDTPPIGLISHWPADNNSNDIAGSNEGTLVSGASYTTGQIGQAFYFDGVDDRVIVDDSPSLRLTKSMTIEGWVRVDSFPGVILFRGDDRGGLDPYVLSTGDSGEIFFGINGLTEGATVSAPMPQGEFVYVAATLDDATGEMSLYLNGIQFSQRITTVRPFGDLDPNSNPGIGIGNHGGYPTTPHNFPFHGAIDELKVHDVALTETEIIANYNAGKGSLQPTLSVDDVTVVEGDLNYIFNDVFASGGGLSLPRGIIFGPDGHFYVSSSGTDSILRYDGTTGAFIDEFVAPGSGGLDSPREIVFHNGDLYVVSNSSHSILRFNGTTGESLGEFVASGSGGLEQPRGLLFGTNNDLYVTSAGENDAILRYNATDGTFIDEFVSSGDNGLNNPSGFVLGPDGNFYVSSTNSSSNSILRYDPNGDFIDPFVSNRAGGLDGPTGMLFHDGLLYVISHRSRSILAFDQITGEFSRIIVSSGSGGLSNPSRMLLDGNGDLLVSSRSTGNVIRYRESNSASLTVSLSYPIPEEVTVEFSTAEGSAIAGSDYLSTTGSLTFAPGETTQVIHVPILSDAISEIDESFTVNLESPSNATIADSTGVVSITERRIAIDDVTVTEGDSTPHYRGPFVVGIPGAHFNPLTFGPNGDIYTAVGTGTGYNTVQRFDGTTGAFIETFIDNSDPDHKINGVRDIVFHPTDGRVYVASSYTDEVLRYDAQTGAFIDVFVSANSGGIDHPDGMMFGPDSNSDGLPELYVTGWLSHNVVRYDGATGQPLGTYVTPSSGGLNYPFAMAMRGNELFVTSAGTNQILKYYLDSGNYIGVAASTGLSYPRGITFGPDDLMYVTSGNNDRIIRYTPQGTYVDDYVPAGTGGMDNPRTPRFGPDGNLYVTSTGNDEIMRFGTESEAVFSITLSIPSSQPVTFDYNTADNSASLGSDYDAASGTITFQPGETRKSINVPITDDAVEEPIESFFVNLSSATGAVIQDDLGVATIIDDDAPASSSSLYVYDIRFESNRNGKNWRAVFEIRSDSNANGLADSNDQVQAGVTITVLFNGQEFTGTTDANGIFRTSWQRNLSSGDYYANAVDLILADYLWELGLDDEDDSDGDGFPDDLLII